MDESIPSEKMVYDFALFATQLKKLRLYKGYRNQCDVCKITNISRQVFSLWELNRRLPSIQQLVMLANFFQVKIEFFFIPDAIPEAYVIPNKEENPL